MRRAVVPLALSLALPLVAAAQDGPPAGLLDHVKPGQRWVLATGAPGDPAAIEETLTVLEVVPAEGRVVYLGATRLRVNGTSTTQPRSATEEWTWGSRPAEVAQLPGVTSERRALEVPGMKLDTLVWRQGSGQDALESQVAVKGELETFPGIVGAGPRGALARRLVRVDQGPVPPRPPAPAALVAHVRPGQRWTFRLGAEGAASTVVRTVTAVDPDTGTVTYDERTTAEGQEPTVEEGMTWSAGDCVPLVEGPEAKTEARAFEAPGVKLECRLVTLGGTQTTWTAVKGDVAAFPGVVRVTQGGAPLQELVKVE